ncbi:carbon storage regulator [Rhodopirellula sp. MGV]|uniref:carbon storage regulator n=1 Tax=Rhodopirellula sp. MGV TaxID=2023130 RepID=UPI000B9676FF|nr:carbon storage regulator [Rhodopirellula sp. MGV]OYP38277.1 hypothetical protein CGZ80_03425 [Rhodopirellula sp. MGV]PNY38615.1 carbon storage regulator [Rhodopirellula baltica]
MLVLTRLEDQRVVFPEVGISVCIVQARKGKTRIGINAPKGIRVVRDELVPDFKPIEAAKAFTGFIPVDSHQPSPTTLTPNQRLASTPEIEEQVELATGRLQQAQAELEDGNRHDALILIGQALAELDQLRADTQHAKDRRTDEQPQGVAEPAAAYHSRSTSDAAPRRIIVVNRDDAFGVSQPLCQHGFEIENVGDSFHAFIELSRAEKANAIVFHQVAVSPGDLDIIRNCSQQPDIPILIIGTDSDAASDLQQSLDHNTVVINTDHPSSIVWEVESAINRSVPPTVGL